MNTEQTPEEQGPTIEMYFSDYTQESISQGDSAENGQTETYKIEPDEFDIENAKDSEQDPAVFVAINYLSNEGIDEQSSSDFHSGIWYIKHEENESRHISAYDNTIATEYTYHLSGFTVEQEQAIYEAVSN